MELLELPWLRALVNKISRRNRTYAVDQRAWEVAQWVEEFCVDEAGDAPQTNL
jgi:hypothetical protein